MKKIIVTIVCILLFSGCSAMKPQADGRYFDIASNNNSEASIWLEEIIVDNRWRAPGTGIMGCGTSNINGGGGVSSPPYDAIAPQESIYIEWYSWKEKARMKAIVSLPESDIINKLLIEPPWLGSNNRDRHRSKIIIDFRPKHKIWVKLAKNANPKSQEEVMILGEGKGVKTDEVVTKYSNYEEGKSVTLDCIGKRKRLKKLGYYTAPLVIFDKWYPGSPRNKERKSE